jgi:hydroxymethylbilane synthase
MKFKIATRGSKLAMFQAEHAKALLQRRFPEHQWNIVTFTTTGDRFNDKPLSEFGGKGAFLKEIEEALIRDDADLAVHSLKDVPAVLTPGLELEAFLPREDPRDVWVSEQDELMHLAPGKRVGTSSLRREVLIRFFRPDLKVEMLRGNLDTRLRKLRERQYDAIVVAAAGLHRLQLFDEKIMHLLSEDAFIPAIGQGTIVLQAKANYKVSALLKMLNDPISGIAARIERGFLSVYQGGCHLPIGGFATLESGAWTFRAFIGGIRSGRIVQEFVRSALPDDCIKQMQQKLDAQGARELLAESKEANQ